MRIFRNWQVTIVLFLVLLVMFPTIAGAPAARKDSYTAGGGYFLELDGLKMGFVKSFEGGGISAQVINEPVGPNNVVKKHTGQPMYEEINITFGTGMEQSLYKWMADTMTNQYQRKSGSIIELDSSSNIVRRYDFHNALITEISFPAMDAAREEVVFITVKLKPEYIQINTTAAGTHYTTSSSTSKSKYLFANNFRLSFNSLSPTNRILRIDEITLKNEPVSNEIGGLRDYDSEPSKLSVPNLVITMAEKNAQPFIDWNDDFVIKGNNDDSKEKSATLEYLSQDLQTIEFRLKFDHVGIFRLTQQKNINGFNSVKAEMYVEKITFEYPAGPASLGTVSSNDANNVTPSPTNAAPAETPQTTQTIPDQTETPSIVTLQGKLTSSANGKPVQKGSIQVTIKDLSGEQVWQSTFDGAINNGEFNIQLGASKELDLVPNTMYEMVVAIDAESAGFSKADVTFGDNSPKGDIIKFKV